MNTPNSSRTLPQNLLRRRLVQQSETQAGLWLSAGSPTIADIAGGAGFDWALVDGEHGPNTLETLQNQLRALAPYRITPVVRPAESNRVLIKQVLDIGAQALLLPMINSRQQAEDVVAATRYPPRGVRGVGASIARSGQWGRITDYMDTAENELLIIVQVESREALDNLDEIIKAEGIDGIFIGPADLGASLGNPPADQLDATVCDALARIRRAGLIAGSIALEAATATKYAHAGANLLAIASDTDLLVHAFDDAVAQFHQTP